MNKYRARVKTLEEIANLKNAEVILDGDKLCGIMFNGVVLIERRGISEDPNFGRKVELKKLPKERTHEGIYQYICDGWRYKEEWLDDIEEIKERTIIFDGKEIAISEESYQEFKRQFSD